MHKPHVIISILAASHAQANLFASTMGWSFGDCRIITRSDQLRGITARMIVFLLEGWNNSLSPKERNDIYDALDVRRSIVVVRLDPSPLL